MRVVAGSARGRRLVTPEGHEVRPSSDRVREATFNALGSMDVLVGADVVDLFAGSGALGIEALSRGARHAWFVDRSTESLRAVRRNLASLGLEPRATVLRGDASKLLTRPPTAGWPERFDVALVDPPYRFDRWDDLLSALHATVVVMESDREIRPADGARVVRTRRYGGTVVTIARTDVRDDHGRANPEDRS